MKVTVIVDTENLCCPLCRDKLVTADTSVAECEECGTKHHAECIEEFSKCGAFECGGVFAGSLWVETYNGDRLIIEDYTDYGDYANFTATDGGEWMMLHCVDDAEEMIRERFQEMDASELACYVGEETLAMWGAAALRGENRAEQWLNDVCRERGGELSPYDGCEVEVREVSEALSELDSCFTDGSLLYRVN